MGDMIQLCGPGSGMSLGLAPSYDPSCDLAVHPRGPWGALSTAIRGQGREEDLPGASER